MALQTYPQEKRSAIQSERAFAPSYERKLADFKRHGRCDSLKSPRARAGLLGHAQVSTTLDIYTHAFDKNKKAASDKLHNALEI